MFKHPLVVSGLLSMSPWLHKSAQSEELLFFLCPGNGILKTNHRSLSVATVIFPNNECLGWSTENLICKCGDEQYEGGSHPLWLFFMFFTCWCIG